MRCKRGDLCLMQQKVRGPKQERSERTLARILDSAELMFSERGIADVPVRDICDAAKTSPSSFYARFADKSALLHALMDRRSKRVFSRIDEFRGAVPDEKFERFIERVIDGLQRFFREDRRLRQALLMAAEDDQGLLIRARWIDTEILRRVFEVASERFPDRDWDRIETGIKEGLPIIAAAFRGGTEVPGEIGLENDDAHQRVVRDLSALILRFVEPVD